MVPCKFYCCINREWVLSPLVLFRSRHVLIQNVLETKHHCTTKQSQSRERGVGLAFGLSFDFCMKYVVQTMRYSLRNYLNSRVEWCLKRARLVACVSVCPDCVIWLTFALCLILTRDFILLKNACFERLVIHISLDAIVLLFCLCAYLLVSHFCIPYNVHSERHKSSALLIPTNVRPGFRSW